MDPDQDQHSVGPELGPNCLHMLSTDDTSRQKVNLYQMADGSFFMRKTMLSLFVFVYLRFVFKLVDNP